VRQEKAGALLRFGAATLLVGLGIGIAFARFPGGYDWAYTVISKLASVRQNPTGGRWLAGSLLAAVVFLWPVARYLDETFSRSGSRPRHSVTSLRIGLVGGALLGLEGVFTLDFSRRLHKAHEALALITFVGFYGGVLGLYLDRIRRDRSFLPPALLVILPLCAVGLTQFVLYLGQRDLGWVNTDWRELGVPFWLSFAFWQWLAVAFLGFGLGYLIAAGDRIGRPQMERGEDRAGSRTT